MLEITATRGWRAIDLRELWAYRELLYILVWRDLKVRYRQTLLGALWVMGQPLLTMGVFTLVFHRVGRIEGHAGIPYPVFVLTGLVPWSLFSSAVSTAGNSLIGSSHLISKVYFPRLLVPASAVIGAGMDLLVNLALVLVVMTLYSVAPDHKIILLPLFILVALGMALGVGLWLSALNVEYRDVRVVIPFLLQSWMFMTPVAYPIQALPERYRALLRLNPMNGIVEAFRASLTGGRMPWTELEYSTIVTIAVLLSGAYYFRRTERLFADVL